MIQPNDSLRLVVHVRGRAHAKALVAELRAAGHQVESEMEPEAGELERLRAVVEHAADAIFVKDLEGRYRLLNEAGAALFERPAAEVIGRTDEELLGAERSAPIRARDAEVLTRRARVTYEQRRLVGGREIVYLTSKAPYLSPGGELLGLVGVSKDVTELRHMEAKLVLADRMISVGTLATGVAHEINNPLACVTGNLDFSLGKVEEVMGGPARGEQLDEVVQALRDGVEGARRIAQVVRDLRIFARENDAVAPTDVGQVLQVAMRLTQHKLKQRAEVELVLPPLPPVAVNAPRLGQVFASLLVNAAQAMPLDRDAAAGRIRVAAFVEGDRVIVELEDNGIGMDEEVLRHIFDPFFTTRRIGEGMGLGLWICRNVLEGMGGELTVASEPSVGSVVRVRLPL